MYEPRSCRIGNAMQDKEERGPIARERGRQGERWRIEKEPVPRSSNYSQSEVVIFGGALADGNDK